MNNFIAGELSPMFVNIMNQVNQNKLGATMDCTEELKTLRDLYANKIALLEADLANILPNYLAYSRKFNYLHEELATYVLKYDSLVDKVGEDDEEGEE